MAAAQRSAHGDTLHSESLSDCEAEAAKKATDTKRRPSGSRLRYLHVSSNFAIIDNQLIHLQFIYHGSHIFWHRRVSLACCVLVCMSSVRFARSVDAN
jgi:hypothetical protein